MPLSAKDPVHGGPVEAGISLAGTMWRRYHEPRGDRRVCRTSPMTLIDDATGDRPVFQVFVADLQSRYEIVWHPPDSLVLVSSPEFDYTKIR